MLKNNTAMLCVSYNNNASMVVPVACPTGVFSTEQSSKIDHTTFSQLLWTGLSFRVKLLIAFLLFLGCYFGLDCFYVDGGK